MIVSEFQAILVASYVNSTYLQWSQPRMFLFVGQTVGRPCKVVQASNFDVDPVVFRRAGSCWAGNADHARKAILRDRRFLVISEYCTREWCVASHHTSRGLVDLVWTSSQLSHFDTSRRARRNVTRFCSKDRLQIPPREVAPAILATISCCDIKLWLVTLTSELALDCIRTNQACQLGQGQGDCIPNLSNYRPQTHPPDRLLYLDHKSGLFGKKVAQKSPKSTGYVSSQTRLTSVRHGRMLLTPALSTAKILLRNQLTTVSCARHAWTPWQSPNLYLYVGLRHSK